MVETLRYRDDAVPDEPAVSLEAFFEQSNADSVRIEAGAGAASTRSLQRQSSRPFPRIFATTSMNDTRVLYVEPLKWVSRLQAAGIDAIIKIEVEAGHGGTSGRYKQWREVSYENAWCLSIMGLTR